MAYAAFRSIGAYVPSKILTNEDLSKMVDTTDEWITKEQVLKSVILQQKMKLRVT